jgi:hypothetical protein
VGAAFLLFGTVGLNRSSLTALPGKGEMALVGGAIAADEYGALTSSGGKR